MWVDTTSIHSDNPGWRDMVCSYFHEWLTTFMIAVSKTCLALVLQKTYPLKGRWGRGVPLEPAADRIRVEFRTDGKMDDHITHLPARTGAGAVPRRRRQGAQ